MYGRSDRQRFSVGRKDGGYYIEFRWDGPHGCHVPQLDHRVTAGAGNPSPVRAERHATDPHDVPAEVALADDGGQLRWLAVVKRPPRERRRTIARGAAEYLQFQLAAVPVQVEVVG